MQKDIDIQELTLTQNKTASFCSLPCSTIFMLKEFFKDTEKTIRLTDMHFILLIYLLILVPFKQDILRTVNII